MSKTEKELHKQVEQQRYSLKKLIDRFACAAKKEQNFKQGNPNFKKNLKSNK